MNSIKNKTSGPLPPSTPTTNKTGGARVESDKGPTTKTSLASAAKPLPVDKVDADTNSGKIVEGQPIDDVITPNRSDEATTAKQKKSSISSGKRRHAPPRYELYLRFAGFWGWRDTRDPSIQGMLSGDKAVAEAILYEMNEAHESEHLPPKKAVGELAQLKSGGPVMTIAGVLRDGRVICSWFRGDLIKRKTFGIDALRIPQPKKGLRDNFSKPAKKRHRQKAAESTATNSTTNE